MLSFDLSLFLLLIEENVVKNPSGCREELNINETEELREVNLSQHEQT